MPVAAALMVADCSIHTQANLSLIVAVSVCCVSYYNCSAAALRGIASPKCVQTLSCRISGQKKKVSHPPSGFGSSPHDCLMQYFEYNLIGCLEMYLYLIIAIKI